MSNQRIPLLLVAGLLSWLSAAGWGYAQDSMGNAILLDADDRTTGEFPSEEEKKTDYLTWYRFAPGLDGSLTIAIEEEETIQIALWLYDENGKEITSTPYDTLHAPRLAAGTYYLLAMKGTNLAGDRIGHGKYTLKTSFKAAGRRLRQHWRPLIR